MAKSPLYSINRRIVVGTRSRDSNGEDTKKELIGTSQRRKVQRATVEPAFATPPHTYTQPL